LYISYVFWLDFLSISVISWLLKKKSKIQDGGSKMVGQMKSFDIM